MCTQGPELKPHLQQLGQAASGPCRGTVPASRGHLQSLSWPGRALGNPNSSGAPPLRVRCRVLADVSTFLTRDVFLKWGRKSEAEILRNKGNHVPVLGPSFLPLPSCAPTLCPSALLPPTSPRLALKSPNRTDIRGSSWLLCKLEPLKGRHRILPCWETTQSHFLPVL
jgi:hypothetical protein